MNIKQIHRALDRGNMVVAKRYDAKVIRIGEELWLEGQEFRLPIIHPVFSMILVLDEDLFTEEVVQK